MTPPSSRPGRCWACGEAHRAADDPAEHIVGSALGSVLTTNGFALSCNRELGVRVDQPFLRDFLVAVRRARYDIRDPRRPHRPPANPRHVAETESGWRVFFDWRDNGIHVPPHVVEDEERVLITAASEEEALEIAATKIARLREQGKDGKLQPTVDGTVAGAPSKAHMGISLDARIRARVAAKIALGAFSLVLPEDWLDSEAAKLLQSWLWDESPRTAEGGKIFAGPRRPPAPLDGFCRPPEHLLSFIPTVNAEVRFGMILFGEEFMAVSAGPLGQPPPQTAWCLDPIARTCLETTFSDLALRAVESYGAEPSGSPA
jgi:hypothetical protein